MKLLLLSTALIFSFSTIAQQVNPEIFRKNVDILYEAAAKGFKEIKTEADGTTDAGDQKFLASRKVSGAKDVFISVDSEDSHTYIALFESKDMESAKKKVEEMATMISEQVAEKGLVRKKATDMAFEGYRKETIEFDSDNIDKMGKYPSFSVGILRDSTPPIIQLAVNEPLWK